MAKRFRGAGARRDANEDDVVAALEKRGCTVWPLEGAGVPDLLVWVPVQSRFILVEVKDGAKTASKRKLRVTQAEFFAEATRLGAPVFKVEHAHQVAAIVGRFAA